MRYDELLEAVGDLGVFESSLLLAGEVDRVDVASQLSRWTKAGRLVQLRRGLYALAEPYARRRTDVFAVANLLVQPSYVSLQSALAYHGLIPDVVQAVTSVTTGRPQERDTPLGRFQYRHVKPAWLWGASVEAVGGDNALLAMSEKALLDLAYLERDSGDPRWVSELRLQNLERVDVERLRSGAERSGSRHVRDFVDAVLGLREQEGEQGGWRT
ncbi:MAG: hypothetical protein WC971_09810 [Coriobacteriia bacterium]